MSTRDTYRGLEENRWLWEMINREKAAAAQRGEVWDGIMRHTTPAQVGAMANQAREEKASGPRAECPKCRGAGHFPCFSHVSNGVCFRCGGDGDVLVSSMSARERARL